MKSSTLYHLALLLLLFSPFCSKAQFNDSLFFKSGMTRVVEIDTFTTSRVYYTYLNKKGDTIQSRMGAGQLRYFKIYNDQNELTFNSTAYYGGMPGKNQENLLIAKHLISINPFSLVFLGGNLRYSYTFGKQMQWALNTRLMYTSPLLYGADDFGSFFIGTGIKYIPFYNERFSFGFDFTPSFAISAEDREYPQFWLPVGVGLDFFIRERLAFSVDFKGGQAFDYTTPVYLQGFLGMSWRFKKRQKISRPVWHMKTIKEDFETL